MNGLLVWLSDPGMSKATIRNHNFRELRANFSNRIKANGDYTGFADPTLYAPLLAQYKAHRDRIKELGKKESKTPEDHREMANKIRLCGDWAKLLRDIGQCTFEHAFIAVAQARLPKEHFMVMVNEAREIWRLEGFAEGLPRNEKKVRKLRRKIGK